MKLFIFFISVSFEIRGYCSQGIYNKPVPEVIGYYGYPSETHSLFTEDGYNLVLHRIPHGRKCKTKNGPPVILFHGLYLSSLSWLFLGPENSLGFILADDCYDVWLANSRGNCYSTEHKNLKTNHHKYWDFSWHELGVYDISDTVDYVINLTKQDEVLFIGVSQGVTSGLVNAIKRPETKIKSYFFLAPVSYFTESPSPNRALSPLEPLLTFLTQKVLGTFPTNSDFKLLKPIENIICELAPDICGLQYANCGYNPPQYNDTGLAAYALQSCPISIKQALHYLQGFNSEFSEYDYGSIDNKKKYGTSSPPKYQVEVINKPVYLYHARKDLCGDLRDVDHLAKELGNNLAKKRLVDNPAFDHLSFNLNVRVKELVYDDLMSDMREALKDA